MSDLKAFQSAQIQAEGLRQSANYAARRAYEADPTLARQAEYAAAVRSADRAYFVACVAAAEQYGIEPSIYRHGLASVS